MANPCTCTAPVWLPDENQWEPGEECSHCREREQQLLTQQWYESVVSSETNSRSFPNEDDDSCDDLPF